MNGRLLSFVTGAAGADGFAGLAGGFGDRRDLLSFGGERSDDADPVDDTGDSTDDLTVALRREDAGRSVDVTYRVGELPGLGPVREHLSAVVDGTASDEERRAVRTAWHDRVRTVLHSEALFDVTEPSEVL